MQGYNVIAVFSEDARQVLMCRRRKMPYKGLLNFVGGKIEPGEDSLEAAYRELREETGITRADIRLSHLMDFSYWYENGFLEVYAGRLSREVRPQGDENELLWVPADSDFFDLSRFAGVGNIGHIMMQVRLFEKQVLGTSGADS